ncbi:hypothetical protein E2C01_096042 [Portunus trituberculatus]|uniref:Uncharacterized protein n=1 Tax=Portunus trituberculatus TaxID=210409 RepID=A0A5B7JUK8_PORTR|nr:hypothetical protein [Portunus trituberculatus]
MVRDSAWLTPGLSKSPVMAKEKVKRFHGFQKRLCNSWDLVSLKRTVTIYSLGFNPKKSPSSTHNT